MSDVQAETPARSWKIYTTPREAWAAMLKDCRAAQETIELESYIFTPDDIGKSFLEVLKKKAREGVRVRILCDMVGSYGFFSATALREELLHGGIKIRFFNLIQPWRIRRFFSWIRRDHRKLLIVDSRIGYTGGLNIAKYMEEWRDTHMRVEDGIVLDFRHAFERMWAAARERRLMRRIPRELPIFSTFFPLTSAPQLHRRYIYRALLKAIRRSQRYVYLTTPYLIPSIRFFKALRRAARRGVDVRVLVPARSDVPIADIGGAAYFTFMLKAGIRIFRYTGGVLHVKTAVVDDSWATLGSANFDNISLFFNFEFNLASMDPAFAEEMKQHFLRDAESAEELTLDVWAERPWYRKVIEALLLPFHGVL